MDPDVLELAPAKYRSRTTYEYNGFATALFWLWHIAMLLLLVGSLAGTSGGRAGDFLTRLVAALTLFLQPWAFGAVILGSIAHFTRKSETVTEIVAPPPAAPQPPPKRARGEPRL